MAKPLSPPPVNTPMTDRTARCTSQWNAWFVGVYERVGKSLGLITQPFASYTVATVPAAADSTGMAIYVTNEVGGAVLAFSDGTNWRRVTDRAVIS